MKINLPEFQTESYDKINPTQLPKESLNRWICATSQGP